MHIYAHHEKIFPFLILLLAAVSCTSEQKRVFNIADLGAVDGQVCTRAIQQAMDQCSEAGGYWDNMLIEAYRWSPVPGARPMA